MHMAHNSARWTLDELHRLPDDGNRYEVVRGALFVTPPPSVAHEILANLLARILDRYAESQNLGCVYRPRAALRIDDSETEPDLTVRQVTTPPPSSWENVPLPILVVEILSSTTRRRDRVDKRALYMEARIPCYWMVDPMARTILVVRPAMEDVVRDQALVWHPEGASSPLRLDVQQVFREALGR